MAPRCFLVFACALVLAGGRAWADDETVRVRTLDAAAAKVLQAARDGSPTVRRLLDRLERSDLIVYVQVVPRFEKPRASTSIVSAVPRARFVLISITTLSSPWDRFLLLGHELQHAVELADAPAVRDRHAMEAHYQRIGWRDRANVYETAVALDTGHLVRREMLDSSKRVRPDSVVAEVRPSGSQPSGSPPAVPALPMDPRR
ncbi:MAG: hypothetical protein KBA95_11590 [Acidobacteria bacterium]|nr:hypothetical protein [Acidobacteriota bacterium]